MLKNSQTKVFAAVITLGLVREHDASKKTIFTDSEVRKAYHSAVHQMKEFLGHDVHIGAKYYDAYCRWQKRTLAALYSFGGGP